MTQISSIAQFLLKGNVLSIMNGYHLFNCTNAPREVSRSIEKKFGLIVSREKVSHTSAYGHKGFYFRYRLNKTEYNRPGIELMRKYIKDQK